MVNSSKLFYFVLTKKIALNLLKDMWTVFPFLSFFFQAITATTSYSIVDFIFRVWSFISVEKCEEQSKGKNLWIAILNSGVMLCHAMWKSVVTRLMKVITKSNWMNAWPRARSEEVIDLNNFLKVFLEFIGRHDCTRSEL